MTRKHAYLSIAATAFVVGSLALWLNRPNGWERRALEDAVDKARVVHSSVQVAATGGQEGRWWALTERSNGSGNLSLDLVMGEGSSPADVQRMPGMRGYRAHEHVVLDDGRILLVGDQAVAGTRVQLGHPVYQPLFLELDLATQTLKERQIIPTDSDATGATGVVRIGDRLVVAGGATFFAWVSILSLPELKLLGQRVWKEQPTIVATAGAPSGHVALLSDVPVAMASERPHGQRFVQVRPLADDRLGEPLWSWFPPSDRDFHILCVSAMGDGSWLLGGYENVAEKSVAVVIGLSPAGVMTWVTEYPVQGNGVYVDRVASRTLSPGHSEILVAGRRTNYLTESVSYSTWVRRMDRRGHWTEAPIELVSSYGSVRGMTPFQAQSTWLIAGARVSLSNPTAPMVWKLAGKHLEILYDPGPVASE